MLVNHLLSSNPDLWDDVLGLDENADGYRPEIFQWLAFAGLAWMDYEDLIAAEIPVLDTEYGTWVGITSWGSPYEVYVYPQLIEALFGVRCRAEDIEAFR